MEFIKLNSILGKDLNNFNLLRLIAALAVIYGHSFALFNPNGHAEPIKSLVGYEYIGSIAVYVFFFISGIFITASFCKDSSAVRYAAMRIFRIFPGLIICLLITAFVVGPLISTLTINNYFNNPDTFLYVLTNAKVSDYFDHLPGVFVNNFMPRAVNGSLWTLAVEVRCYLFVLCAGILGLLKTGNRINATCILLILMAFFFWEYIPYFSNPNNRPAVVPGGFFILGMLCYANRNWIIIDWRIMLFSFFTWFVLRNFSESKYLLYFSIAYFVLVFASSRKILKIRLKDDYSYGVYIYGFVIQQTVAYYFPSITAYESLVITIPICLFAGFWSWRLVEKPSLKIANIFHKKIEFGEIKSSSYS